MDTNFKDFLNEGNWVTDLDLTNKQFSQLKKAVYMIADATSIINGLNKEMIKGKVWNGQADIAAVADRLNDINATEAGGIGAFLKAL